MRYLKIFFPFIIANLSVSLVFAQSNRVYKMVTPSDYQDTVNKSTVITEPKEQKNIKSEKGIHQESITVVPESKLSIGKASAVPTAERGNQVQSVSGEKNKINYSQQKIEKQETPGGSPSLNPK